MDKQRQLDDFFGLDTDQTNPKDGQTKKPLIEGIGEAFNKKGPSLKNKFRLLPKVLSKKERYIILIFLLLAAGSILSIPLTTYYHFTIPAPAYGGTIEEGVIGEPRHINPLLSQSDADRDLVKLVYSSLLKYSPDGKLIPDLAKSYEISQDELNYTIHLKEQVKWHDGESFNADDVIFTVDLTQDSDYGSLQRINWLGVEVEKVNDYTIVFKLKNKYAQFLNNLTLPIMPHHKWEDIKPINFSLSELNLKPTGSGPYKFKKFQKDKNGHMISYELEANKNFYLGRPNINSIEIKFYGSEDELINAYNQNKVENLSLIFSQNLKKLKFKQRLTVENVKMPRYFGIFFNQNQSKILSDKNIRLALAHATDKQSLIDKILEGNGLAVESPILADLLGDDQETKKYEYSIETATEMLKKSGWEIKDENGILKKGDEKLSIRLTTSTLPELAATAQNLKEQWQAVGIDVEIENLPSSALQQAIKDRNYQMLLFGEILNLDPDLFSLWHSSQKRDPGLNLALYDNKTADTLLDDARKTLNPEDRARKYDDFHKLVADDIPALFLYNPYYLYSHSKKIQGFTNTVIGIPSERFSDIASWYVETKRIWR